MLKTKEVCVEFAIKHVNCLSRRSTEVASKLLDGFKQKVIVENGVGLYICIPTIRRIRHQITFSPIQNKNCKYNRVDEIY